MLLLDKSLAAAVSILSRVASATTGHSGLPHDRAASVVGEKPLNLGDRIDGRHPTSQPYDGNAYLSELRQQ
jgi:hypothetical protein